VYSTYDALGRLIGESRAGTLAWQRGYAYDGAGNLVRVVEDGLATVLSYDAAGRLVSMSGGHTATLTWNANGQLTASTLDGVARAYGYDAEGRLVSVTGADFAVTYEYDPLGRLVRATRNGAVTSYAYDGVSPASNLVAEYDSTGAVRRRWLASRQAGDVYAVIQDGRTYGYLRNLDGSVLAVLDATDGSVVARYAMDAYGAPVAGAESDALGDPIRFAGRPYDAATGLVHMGMRHYSPALRRFLQRDPAMDEVAGALDPSGLKPKWLGPLLPPWSYGRPPPPRRDRARRRRGRRMVRLHVG
jgi:RHS repeat-associated protein